MANELVQIDNTIPFHGLTPDMMTKRHDDKINPMKMFVLANKVWQDEKSLADRKKFGKTNIFHDIKQSLV